MRPMTVVVAAVPAAAEVAVVAAAAAAVDRVTTGSRSASCTQP